MFFVVVVGLFDSLLFVVVYTQFNTLKFPSTLRQFFTVRLNLSKELATLRVVIILLLLNKKNLGHHACPVSHVLMGANSTSDSQIKRAA